MTGADLSAPTDSVAFVVPVFNGRATLRETVDSVLRQSVRDFQVLLADDCSSDGSLELVRSQPDTRITCIVNPQRLGLYGNLMAAIRMVKAEWIGIVMQDDRLHSHYLAEMQIVSRLCPTADAIWATEHTIDAQGARIRTGVDTGRIEIIDPGPAAWRGALARGCIWTISGSFTRRRVLLEAPFDDRYPHCGDYDWVLRSLRSRTFVYLERPLLDIRVHEGQASTANLRSGRDVREAFEIIQRNVSSYADDLSAAEVWRICRRRLYSCLRRGIVALPRGRWTHAALMFVYAIRFLALACIRRRRMPSAATT